MATNCAISLATRIPSGPVQALAFPLLMRMARPMPFLKMQAIKDNRGGHDSIRREDPRDGSFFFRYQQRQIELFLFLNSAIDSGSPKPERGSDASWNSFHVKSCVEWKWLVCGLINARGLGIDAGREQAHLFRISEHEIHGLNGLSCRSLDQVING